MFRCKFWSASFEGRVSYETVWERRVARGLAMGVRSEGGALSLRKAILAWETLHHRKVLAAPPRPVSLALAILSAGLLFGPSVTWWLLQGPSMGLSKPGCAHLTDECYFHSVPAAVAFLLFFSHYQFIVPNLNSFSVYCFLTEVLLIMIILDGSTHRMALEGQNPNLQGPKGT